MPSNLALWQCLWPIHHVLHIPFFQDRTIWHQGPKNSLLCAEQTTSSSASGWLWTLCVGQMHPNHIVVVLCWESYFQCMEVDGLPSGVPEVPLVPAVTIVGTVIPKIARVAVVEGAVPVVVTTVIVAEIEAVAVMCISSIMDRSAKSSPSGLGTAIAMVSQVSILSVFWLVLMKGVRLPLFYCQLTSLMDSSPLDGSVCSFICICTCTC